MLYNILYSLRALIGHQFSHFLSRLGFPLGTCGEDAEVKVEVGERYNADWGVVEDPTEAMQWCWELAALGSREAELTCRTHNKRGGTTPPILPTTVTS
jgi:hypothetical protein